MKNIGIFFLMFFIPASVHALTHTVGFSASTFSGAGTSYKYRINERYQVKASGFVFGRKSSREGVNNFSYNLGSEGQMNLYQTPKTRFYGLLGGSYWYDDSSYSDMQMMSANTPVQVNGQNSLQKDLQLGLGIGFEVLLFDNISANIDSGYKYVKSLVNDSVELGFGLGVGLGYTFD